jgi:hypothetical protein
MGPRSGGRSRASNGGDTTSRGERDEYDLLTAAALGLVAGAGLALLFRLGTRRKRTPRALAREAGGMAAAAAGRAGLRGAKWAKHRGEEVWDSIPIDEIGDQLGEYVQNARDTIDETVSHELNDLRKAVRRHRKRLGI